MLHIKFLRIFTAMSFRSNSIGFHDITNDDIKLHFTSVGVPSMHWDINHQGHRDLYHTNLLFYLERRAGELTQMYGSETGRSSQNKMAVYRLSMYGTFTYITGGIESYTHTDDLHDHNIIYKKCGFRQEHNFLIEKTCKKKHSYLYIIHHKTHTSNPSNSMPIQMKS